MSVVLPKRRNPPPRRHRCGHRRARLRIQAHLTYVELLLRIRTRDSHHPRRATLDLLRDYRRNGVFPVNTYRPHASPVLVDRDGTRCAVAHLMDKTGAEDLVLKLDRRDKFVWVEDIEDHEVARWLSSVGLTTREAALIQPTYDGQGCGNTMPCEETPPSGYEWADCGCGELIPIPFDFTWLLLGLALIVAVTIVWKLPRRGRPREQSTQKDS